jgi:hypothetical protein
MKMVAHNPTDGVYVATSDYAMEVQSPHRFSSSAAQWAWPLTGRRVPISIHN